MKTLYATGLFLLLLFSVHACSTAVKTVNTKTRILRPAEDTPAMFVPLPGKKLDTRSCKNPMIDPRNGIKIILNSPSTVFGNYRVKVGVYDVQKGELLRLDCTNGEVLGIVKE